MRGPLIPHEWGLRHPVVTSAVVTAVFAVILVPLVVLSAPPEQRLMVGVIIGVAHVVLFVLQLQRILRTRAQEADGRTPVRRWPPNRK